MENMILMANLDLPSRAIREQIAAAVHVILQVSRFSDGSRKVTHISEVAGMEGQVITMQDIFRYEQTGIDTEGRVRGAFRSTGIRPRFAERFEALGIQLAPNLFSGVAA
jgi:pilus assembly protein CpaF